ncbi:MAG TPA: glycosyltransferase family 2 protein [Gammaproteobacteria bacterium]|nr:glycosyltransferase family 2 protein [Gammaproteobacteria bacterium]
MMKVDNNNNSESLGTGCQPELTVVIPTFNESGNIDSMLQALHKTLTGINWEVIFVDDDSADHTAARVRERACSDPRVRLIHRLSRKGLSSACVEGMLSSTSPVVAVMDADMQHDETLLPEMLYCLNTGDLDLVVASRYIEKGDPGGLGKQRVRVSRAANYLSQMLLKVPLTDPLSGFFMLRRELIEEVYPRLYGQGFKILLDICATLPREIRYSELPYSMRKRHAGSSKLSGSVVLEFFNLLVSRIANRYLPAKFILFSFVGLSGVVIHMTILTLLFSYFQLDFQLSLVAAILVSMTSNYILNNRYTFREVKLSGSGFFRGLLSFYAVCSIGAAIGFATGVYLYSLSFPWWASGLITTVVSALWNFSMSSIFTWKSAGRA